MTKAGPERRLAAIVAIDVVGYSRLMGTDEKATFITLKSHQEALVPLVQSRNGRIVNTAGDGFLLEFTSAVEALDCALEIQSSMTARNLNTPDDRKMLFRIGINLGDVIVHTDNDIFGDGVNVAARLEQMSSPGKICISEAVYAVVLGKLDVTFEDLGPQTLKNITAPIHAYQVNVPEDVSSHPVSPSPPVARHSDQPEWGEAADKPSIAILPFDNMSGDTEQEYLADGMTEDIITALSKFHWLMVIARNSSFAYKGQAVDIKRVGRELGVRYVLEGSVRRAGSMIRITAQLIDTSTSNHVWAERFDRNLDDIFKLQDEASTKIASSIAPELSKAELSAVMRKRSGNLNAWELYVKAMANMPRYGRKREETKELLRQSMTVDPTFADAYAALASCYSADIYALHAGENDEAIDQMFELADQALTIDPSNSRIYQVLCYAHFWRGDMAEAVDAGRRAVDLNSNSADGYEALAAALTAFGDGAEAEACARMCLTLNPLDPRVHKYHFQLMQALLSQRKFEDAFKCLSLCLRARPHDVSYLGFKTVLLGHLGRSEEAGMCLANYLEKRDLKTESDYRQIFVHNSAVVDINLEGLRKAGWQV